MTARPAPTVAVKAASIVARLARMRFVTNTALALARKRIPAAGPTRPERPGAGTFKATLRPAPLTSIHPRYMAPHELRQRSAAVEAWLRRADVAALAGPLSADQVHQVEQQARLTELRQYVW